MSFDTPKKKKQASKSENVYVMYLPLKFLSVACKSAAFGTKTLR